MASPAPKTEAKKAETPKVASPSAAAPAASPAAGSSATAAGSEAEVCRAWRNNGECRFGEKCKYVHSDGEPIAPPPRDYTPRGECHNYRESKECRFAERCRFQHGEEDKRTTYRPERKEKDGAAAGGEESGEKQICRNFQRKGKCRFGDNCHHIHVAGDKKEQAPAAKKAPKSEAKKGPKKEAGKKEAKAAGAAGSDEEKKQKRRRPRKSRTDAGDKLTLTEENKYDGEGIELCRNFRNKGKCRFADDCTFSHAPGGPIGQPAGERPARAASSGGAAGGARVPGLCYNFRDDGECEFGDECRFKHGDADARDFSRPTRARKSNPTGVCYQFQEGGNCQFGADCRFSHEAQA